MKKYINRRNKLKVGSEEKYFHEEWFWECGIVFLESGLNIHFLDYWL